MTIGVADQEMPKQPQQQQQQQCEPLHSGSTTTNTSTNTSTTRNTNTTENSNNFNFATAITTTAFDITTSSSPSTTPSQSPSRHIFGRRILSSLRHQSRRFKNESNFAQPIVEPLQPSQVVYADLSPASPSDPSSSPRSLIPEPESDSSFSSGLSASLDGYSSSPSPITRPWPLSDPGSCPIATFTTNPFPRLETVIRINPSEEKAPPPFRMTRNSGEEMAAATDSQQPSIRFIPFHDPRASRPSLTFQALSRTLPTAESVIKVGRYSERDAQPGDMPRGMPSSAPVGFKSKVVSRRHCEFWCENMQWWVKDVKSSSGTFLNHLRLSPPGVESKPWKVNDGDVIQLGIDFRGGEEMIFRCVKIRIELNRGWQKALNNFNKSTHRRIRKLQEPSPRRDSDNASLSSNECAICLMGVQPCQSLFVAPCSHVWHYKCIRPILTGPQYPQFLCPNCRAVTDLEADIEEAESDWEEDLKEAIAASKTETAEQNTGGSPLGADAALNGVDINGDTMMADVSVPPARPAPGPPASLNTTMATVEATAPSIDSNGVRLASQPPQDRDTSTAAINIPSRTVSPGSRRYELVTNGPVEGPQTPRNDAGPFVLDGGAGATGQASSAAFLGSRLNPSNAASGNAV